MQLEREWAVGEADLRAWGKAVLSHAGLAEDSAGTVIDNLLFAEQRGVRTHGLMRLDVYLRRMRAGGIDVHASPRIDLDTGATCVVDCDGGPGACGAAYVARLAGERAAAHGIAAVIGRNSNHFGSAGYYAGLIADAGAVGVVASNGDSIMSVPGGGRPVLGTHPLAIAVPAEVDGLRPLLDMATSEASYGKLLVASRAGAAIPPTWAVDADGAPTTDADAGLAGALLPAAGPKGFGLAFMIDLLIALGSDQASPEVGALYGADDTPQGVGMIALAIARDRLLEESAYTARVARLMGAVRASRQDGHLLGTPLVPGEPEARAADEAGEVVRIDGELLPTLREIAEHASVPLPEPLDA
jgi:LDH2 family malate/lactate/ureidoglycolate dehydrogenase